MHLATRTVAQDPLHFLQSAFPGVLIFSPTIMPISYTTYMKIFALAYLMSFLISATFEDAIIRVFLSIYLRWLEIFGNQSTPARGFRFPDGHSNVRELRKRTTWSLSLTSDIGISGDPEVIRVDDLPASPARPEHSLSIGILAIIAGGGFLLLMSLFFGLYCCCIRKRSLDKLQDAAARDIEKGDISYPSTFYEDFNEKSTTPTRATPIPVFEFSPPSPTWTPSLPTLSSAIQARKQDDRNRLHPVPPVPTYNRTYLAHSKTPMRPNRQQTRPAPIATKPQMSSPNIKILINDEEHDTDAVIASSSPLMRRSVVKSSSTTQASDVQTRTSRAPGDEKNKYPRNSGLGISTLNFASETPRITKATDHDRLEDTTRSTSTVRGVALNSDAVTKGGASGQSSKRDTWSRLSSAFSRLSRSSLAYLADDDSAPCENQPRNHVGEPIETKAAPQPQDIRTKDSDAELEKRRRRRTGMVGKSLGSNAEFAFAESTISPKRVSAARKISR